MHGATLDWFTGRALETLIDGHSVSASALTLLLRQYATTGRADLREALEPALARALADLDSPGSGVGMDAAAWMAPLVEATAISDDERLPAAVLRLADALRHTWPRHASVADAARAIDAGVQAGSVLQSSDLVASAVDELERVVGRAYTPGAGVRARVDDADAPGSLDDGASVAGMLLTAYSVTERLPYAMLADEIMQHARRRWCDEAGGFLDDRSPDPFRSAAESARVCCRLAGLYGDAGYRQAAVLRPDADYLGAAGRTLERLEPAARARGLDGAVYALALGEWLARTV